MEKRFQLVFDDVMIKQLRSAARNQQIKNLLTKMLDKLELIGSLAGDLLDPKLHIYEVKSKRPPLRLYFKHNIPTDEIYVFEFEMKTSRQKQRKTIDKLRKKASEP
jgi:hypothetical protein